MSKGEATRAAILDCALALSKQIGLEALSIGMLAERLSMSKSGVFAHFGAKEELQIAVLEEAQARFTEQVVRPALGAPRGLTRLRTLFTRWMEYSAASGEPGGCLLIQAAAEFDDKPGAVRDCLVRGQRQWREALSRAVAMCVERGELAADADCEQLAFEIFGLALAAHHDVRLFGEQAGRARALRGLERLLAACAA
ncbi:MAG: TetR/AcrR family transcriptional regulator [Gammaproteobacteria bacterium]|nr:TetR/AcrR family transcriptional regulator [Gammaproteobacteria bacterium]